MTDFAFVDSCVRVERSEMRTASNCSCLPESEATRRLSGRGTSYGIGNDTVTTYWPCKGSEGCNERSTTYDDDDDDDDDHD